MEPQTSFRLFVLAALLGAAALGGWLRAPARLRPPALGDVAARPAPDAVGPLQLAWSDGAVAHARTFDALTPGEFDQLVVRLAQHLGCENSAAFPRASLPPRSRLIVTRGPDGSCATARGPMPGRALVALGACLDRNRAALDDWQALPGIGPRLAERIAREREVRGRFESVADLSAVKGIGPKRLAVFRKFLCD